MAGDAIMAAPGEAMALDAPLAGTRQWPSAPSAYWALFVIVFATFLTFFDVVTFGMLAERIKRDFGLTDSQLGFLAGPASIICYLFIGIPLARLADKALILVLQDAFLESPAQMSTMLQKAI